MKISMMKRMMLILVLGVFPNAAIAQAMERSGGPEFPVQAQRFLLPPSPAVRPAPQIQRPPAPPARTSEIIRPRMADSATGYIDNAIVGSQLRIRGDSAFNVNAPDRAEFFYAKCGCYRFLPSNHPAFDPDAPGPGGADQVEQNLYFQELHLEAELRVGDRFSVSADLPTRSLQPESVARATGIGDIKVGFKYAVGATEDRYLTLQFKTYIPSGNARRGLGTNHTSIEPAFLYHQRFPAGFSLAGQAGLWHPIGGSAGIPTSGDEKFAGGVIIYGIGASQDVYDGANFRLTPVVELVGWRVLNGFQTSTTLPADADGLNIANLKFGVRMDSGGPSSFYIGFGKALTDAVWYEKILRLEYRLVF